MAVRYHEFLVEGFGVFPVDMLRYDQCWPRREIEDTPKIQGVPPPSDIPLMREKAQEVISRMRDKPGLLQEVLRQLLAIQDSALYEGPRKVSMVGLRSPSTGRWDSFGWKVLPESQR
jgi:hypothetical protein